MNESPVHHLYNFKMNIKTLIRIHKIKISVNDMYMYILMLKSNECFLFIDSSLFY